MSNTVAPIFVGLLALALVTLVGADASACKCLYSCSDAIAVGEEVPENITTIAVLPCPGTPLEENARFDEAYRKSHVDLDRLAGEWRPVEFELSGSKGSGQITVPGGWKQGERYRLRVGSMTREFSIVKRLEPRTYRVRAVPSEPVVKPVSYAGGAGCSRRYAATHREVRLEMDKALEPYRHLFIVTQKANGSPYVHRMSNCSIGEPTAIYSDDPFLVPQRCREPEGDFVANELDDPASMTYEISLPGFDGVIVVDNPAPLRARCDGDDKLEEQEIYLVDELSAADWQPVVAPPKPADGLDFATAPRNDEGEAPEDGAAGGLLVVLVGALGVGLISSVLIAQLIRDRK